MKYNNEEARRIYQISEEEAELAQEVYKRRNTRLGEYYYTELEQMISQRRGNTSVLYALFAEFSEYWDWR